MKMMKKAIFNAETIQAIWLLSSLNESVSTTSGSQLCLPYSMVSPIKTFICQVCV